MSSADAKVRKIREDYEKKYSNAEKRHRRTIAALSQQQADELNKAQRSQQERFQDLQSRSQKKITEREREHAAEISKIKAKSLEELESKQQEYRDELRRYQDAKRSQERKLLQIQSSQKDLSTQKRGAEINQIHNKYQEALNQQREQAKQESDRRVQFQKETSQKELDLMRDYLSERTEELDRRNNQLKVSKDQKLAETKRTLTDRMSRLESNHEATIRSERKAHQTVMESRQNTFKDDLKKLQRKYADAVDQRTIGQQEAIENFKDVSNKRYNERLKILESRITELKNEYNAEINKLKAENSLHSKNLVRQYEDKIKNLEEMRQETLEKSKERESLKVRNVIDERDATFRKHFRKIKSENEIEKTKLKQTLQSQTENLKTRNEEISTLAEERVKRIQSDADKKVVDTTQFARAQNEARAEHFENALQAYRVQAQEDTQKQLDSLKKAFQSRERDLELKNRHQTYHHQQVLSQLQNKQRKEIDELNTKNADKIKTLIDQHDMAMERQKATYEMRVRSLIESFREDKERMAQRHRENMDRVIIAKG